MRIAVVGLYRSGSSYWAGVLHHLGVDMGAPYWENDVPHDSANHYESMELVRELPRIWNEPLGESHWSDFDRRRVLRDYMAHRGPIAGGKHPLFCLCVDDLLSAWGPDTKILWSYRPLEDSCDSLIHTTFPWSRLEMYSIQHKLWKASHAHFRRQAPDLTLNLFAMDADARRKAIDRIIGALGLSPREYQVQQAVAGYRKSALCSV